MKNPQNHKRSKKYLLLGNGHLIGGYQLHFGKLWKMWNSIPKEFNTINVAYMDEIENSPTFWYNHENKRIDPRTITVDEKEK